MREADGGVPGFRCRARGVRHRAGRRRAANPRAAALRNLKIGWWAFPVTVPWAEQLPTAGAGYPLEAQAAARLCDTRRIAGQARLNCSHELKIHSVRIGGEGGIRTHVPELPDHPISSRRRYDHFGTSPAEQFFGRWSANGAFGRPILRGWYSSGSWSREGRFAKDG